MLGSLGQFSIVIAFVSLLLCIISYGSGYFSTNLIKQKKWLRFARVGFIMHSLAVLAGIASLFAIIYFHHYEYEYAWKHSSNELPVYFIISAFWEGQEGSFLLWIFWNVGLGLLLIKTSKSWEMSTMTVFCTIQLFLVSMIIGTPIVGDFKIGSSPFLLLKEAMDSEIYTINPSFVPKDGNGLNPLLQNIWMVIHPPVIFLGFALSGIPFSMAMASLWQNEPEKFVQKVSPWVLAVTAVLGTGIVMGAYWAYETLNFGGYWNWDPVENAVFVPWLIFLAIIHGLVLYRRKKKGLALTLFLAMTGFMLILYSTFLTRSGILGNASVHAFTDLGLSGQLLIFLLFFVLAALVALLYRRKSLKEVEEDSPLLSFPFWMVLAICLFCLSAFQILVPTSIPVINAVFNSIGFDANLAPPADQVGFYSKFQLWFAVAFCLAAALGQTFYWKKIHSGGILESEMVFPATLTLVLSSVFVFFGKTSDISYIFLIVAAVYLIIVSLQLLFSLINNMARHALGGLFAHIGMAVMLLGFVYSAGHQKVISQNMAINAPESNLPIHTIQKNLLLSRNIPKENNGYRITYKGARYQNAGSNDYLDKDYTLSTFNEALKVLTKPLQDESGKWINPGDTVQINTENTFYVIDMEDEEGERFTISPRMQNNPTMGYIASPDIKSYFTKDIYTHVTNFPDPEKVKWNEPVKHHVLMNEMIRMDGLMIELDEIVVNEKPPGIPASPGATSLEATVLISDGYASYIARPVYHIDSNRLVRLFPDEIKAIGVKIFLSSIDPVKQQYELTVMTSNRDWITIKSIELPLVSLVWLGAILMITGILISFYFRILEARNNGESAKTFPPHIPQDLCKSYEILIPQEAMENF